MAARTFGIFLVLAALGAEGLAAQGRPINVSGRRDLDFGTVIAGVPTSISRLDATAGHFVIRGVRNSPVLIELTLPTALIGASGSVPLSFGAADGGHGPTSAVGASQPFDPRVPVTVTLSGNGTYYVWLGGSVQPAGQQRPGAYSAAIVLTASYTGN